MRVRVQYCLWCDEEISMKVSWKMVLGGSQRQLICDRCQQHLSPLELPICQTCGRSFHNLSDEYICGDRCLDCVRWNDGDETDVLQKNRSLYTYDVHFKEIIQRFKFRGDVVLAE